jgi:hypothetical protein
VISQVFLAVIGKDPRVFRCRSCADITYQSTMGHRWDRSARSIEKLRARLNWRAGAVPIKPRGMHEKTYQRIFGATGLSRGRAKAGRELRSKIQARSALCPSVVAMPKQVCGHWRMATSLIDRPNGAECITFNGIGTIEHVRLKMLPLESVLLAPSTQQADGLFRHNPIVPTGMRVAAS